MGEISLDMIWKRLEEMQAELKAVRVGLTDLNDTLRAFAKSHANMEREMCRLADRGMF